MNFLIAKYLIKHMVCALIYLTLYHYILDKIVKGVVKQITFHNKI